MASTTSTITLAIRATVEGVRDAVRGARVAVAGMAADVERNRDAFDRVGAAIRRMLTGLAAVGSIGGAVGGVVALTASLSNLLPVLLIAPGAVLAIGAAVATVKLAMSGFADALGGDADALAKLAPSARAVVDQVNALKPAFDDLRRSVQQEFFKNFSGDLKTIAAEYLPVLQRRLPAIAAEFNAMGRSITRALTTNDASFDIGIILAQTQKALGNATNALGHFVSGFIPLAAVGSTYLPAIGTAIDGVADRFRAWSLRVTSDGSLREMIDNALEGFRNLGVVIENIGGIIRAVFTGLAGPAQQDFLVTLGQSTAALREFLETAGAQDALGALGEAFRAVAEVTQAVFLEALRALAPIIVELAPLVAEIAEVVGAALVNAIRIVGPLLTGLAGFLADNKEIIADLAPLVIGLWAAFKGASILTGIATALGPIVTRLGGLAGILRIGGFVALGAVAVELDKINRATAEAEGRDLTPLEDSLSDLVGAGRELVTLNFAGIFADIGAELEVVRAGFENGTSPIGAFKDRLVETATTTGQSFATMGQFVTDFVTRTGESFAQIGTFFSDVATNIGTFFSTLPATIGGFLTTARDTVVTWITDLGTTISTGVQTGFQAFLDFFANLPYNLGFALGVVIGTLINWGTEVVNFFVELPGRIGEAFNQLVTNVQTTATDTGTAFSTTVAEWGAAAVQFFAELPGRAGAAISSLVTTIRDWAVQTGTAFVTEVTTRFNEAVAFVQTIPGKAGAAISALVGILRDKAIEAGTSFITGVTTKFNEAVEFVKGIPGKIAAAIGNLGNLLVNAGKQVIDGLLNGIKQGYQNMLDFVSGIADGIASVKGPLSYDRRVLIPAGLALMEGLLGGLRQGNDKVQEFVSTLAGEVADSIGSGGGDLAARAAALLGRLNTGSGVLADVGFAGAPASASGRAAADLAANGGELRALLERVAAGQATTPEIRVFIGDQELRGLVRVEVDGSDRETIQRAGAGPGASY